MNIKRDTEVWMDALLPLDSTIQQAIRNLEFSGLQIALVVTEDNKLIGTITDGDIRRAFLQGLNLDSTIDHVIKRDPLVVPSEISRDHVLQIMQCNKIFQLPVINQEGCVVGLQVWNSANTQKPLDNVMIIMAGGKGTRLRPHTESCPKPMLEVGGKPMLHHIIEKAFADGFRNILISLNYLGHIIEDYFGDGSNFGVRIDYLREDLPLGTAGSLSLIKNMPEAPFLVTNGDVLTDISYGEFLNYHISHKANATMAVRQYEIQNQFGVVHIDGVEISSFEEKPIYQSHVNAGIYVLCPEALKELQYQQYCDMPTLFERIQKSAGKAIVYPMHEPWLDVGRPSDLLKANNIKSK